MKPGFDSAVSDFGASAKRKLENAVAEGQPEEQLRAPFEQLLSDLAAQLGVAKGTLVAVGESPVSGLKTRPDFAVTAGGALVGFVELKAPGKGADPRKFRDPHDKEQWEKLQSLPNLIYTDGNEFSLWRSGELVDAVVRVVGEIESSGSRLQAPPELLGVFDCFLHWEPVAPRSAKELAHIAARLCRLLREEVTEQLARESAALTSLAADWRKLLFPDASDEKFADGYAQAVTFGLLMARAKGIRLGDGLGPAAGELAKTSSLIGAALRLLTDNAENQATLTTSLFSLTRVLDAVHWQAISKGKPDAWLYFYEEFLEVYDNELRKLTGSYYTPPEVVEAMVRLVDEALRGASFGLHAGLASPTVTLADPAMGTGTFLLGVLRRIADSVERNEGAGAVASAITAAVKRLIAFEMQLGPYAVAELRIHAELLDLVGSEPNAAVRMFVTDTLGNPDDDQGWIPGILAPIANSRKEANRIKREQPITVVIGNPPYKEKAKGLGGWVESGGWIEAGRPDEMNEAPLARWMPPREWGVGTHAKHLRNLYVYFWRWATWKVFDHDQRGNSGIVCFITVAGFLNGPGFQRMREYLRGTCDEIWVVDCSPEGHQPEVNTRIFQGVQQPVCIVLASRSPRKKEGATARVRFQAVPAGHRLAKFEALGKVRLAGAAWTECPPEGRAPFLPASRGAWSKYPKLDDLFDYNGSGVMPGRTWVIAPDEESLKRRWKRLVNAKPEEKERLFHPHLRGGKPGDKHSKRIVSKPLEGYEPRLKPVSEERGTCHSPLPYGFRSFDRQFIIPDSRIINQPNPRLWEWHSKKQIYLTAFTYESPSGGPGLTVTALIPDIHHYKGSFGGRVFPLWADNRAAAPNISTSVLAALSDAYKRKVAPEELFSYIAAVAAHPAYTARFQEDLSTPGLRIPVTADSRVFAKAVEVGRNLVWLHTFGERMTDARHGRPAKPPRLPADRAPKIPASGAIPATPARMPDNIDYDATKRRLLVGEGFVENVDPAVWNYEVSGKNVLRQWFSYRKLRRDRPIIGDRRAPSPLGDIQPESWLAEYTTELTNLLNVLAMLVDLEPAQAKLLETICSGSLISSDQFTRPAKQDLDEARALRPDASIALSLFDSP